MTSAPRRLVSATLMATLLAGCSVTPKPMSTADFATRAQDNRIAVTGSRNRSPARSTFARRWRALKYNLDYRVEQMNQDLKASALKVSTYDMLPQLVASVRISAATARQARRACRC